MTLYQCSDFVEEKCGDCPQGEPHKRDICCGESGSCPTRNLLHKVICIEYDRDPCGDPACCDCFGGDGVSCKE